MEPIITHLLSTGLGVGMRLWNEHRKDVQANERMRTAALAQNAQLLNEQQKTVNASPWMQDMILMMVMIAMLAMFAFPLIAVALDVDLVVLLEQVKTSGFWIFKSNETVKTFEYISGLYLEPELIAIVTHATTFFFGAAAAGMGRR